MNLQGLDFLIRRINAYFKVPRKPLPMKISLRNISTFQIALFLTAVVYLLAVSLTKPEDSGIWTYGFSVFKFWQKGFWELLEFTLQMILILVFGHALALSATVNKFLNWLVSKVDTNAKAVLLTGITAMVASYLNWGFGLILGAVLARKIGEQASRNSLKVNYPLLAASGYLGMMVWHGGISGSAPLKVAEQKHFLVEKIGSIPVTETIFSTFNLTVNIVLFLTIILVLYLLSQKKDFKSVEVRESELKNTKTEDKDTTGWWIGGLMLLLVISELLGSSDRGLGAVDLNFVNFTLLALCFLAFKSIVSLMGALSTAMKGAADILLQFPFYAGILGMMKYSGLLLLMADQMVSFSGPSTFPLLSFVSAALINIFVPSGGGQWAIQGPVMMEAAVQMGLDPAKMVMVFAYGDQVTNMLQPFWALPLLSITGVPASDIFRYTLAFFGAGFLVFCLGLLLMV